MRQSFLLSSGGGPAVFLIPRWDLVERVLSLTPASPLAPQTLYRLELLIPLEEADSGLRAFDGAAYAGEGEVPPVLEFRTAAVMAGRSSPPPPTCQPWQERFVQHCAMAGCHGEGPEASLGLSLVPGALPQSLGRVAHQTQRGASSTTPLRAPSRFGIQMPLLDAGHPENSYLLYKLLIGDEQLQRSGCVSPYQVPVSEGAPPGGCAEPLASAERERLRDWFVQGAPMPPPGSDGASPPLSPGDLRELAAWLEAGAPLETCP